MATRQLLAAILTLSTLSLTAGSAKAAQSDDHVVPLSQLQRDVSAAASQRVKNIADIDNLLSTPAAQEQLSKASLKSEQVTTAISRLDDTELARLADRARAADRDVEAGGRGTILFLVGLAVTITLIVVLTETL